MVRLGAGRAQIRRLEPARLVHEFRFRPVAHDLAAIDDRDGGAKPLDLSGCWSGPVEDTNYGSGTGFLFFKQSGKKAVKGTVGDLDTSGPDSSGALKGKISSTSFTVSYKKGSCDVQFTGQEPSPDTLTGSYTYDCSEIDTSGTFDFTFDSSGATC